MRNKKRIFAVSVLATMVVIGGAYAETQIAGVSYVDGALGAKQPVSIVDGVVGTSGGGWRPLQASDVTGLVDNTYQAKSDSTVGTQGHYINAGVQVGNNLTALDNALYGVQSNIGNAIQGVQGIQGVQATTDANNNVVVKAQAGDSTITVDNNGIKVGVIDTANLSSGVQSAINNSIQGIQGSQGVQADTVNGITHVYGKAPVTGTQGANAEPGVVTPLVNGANTTVGTDAFGNRQVNVTNATVGTQGANAEPGVVTPLVNGANTTVVTDAFGNRQVNVPNATTGVPGVVVAEPVASTSLVENKGVVGVGVNVSTNTTTKDRLYVGYAVAPAKDAETGQMKPGKPGVVIPDGQTIAIGSDGVISASIKLGVADDETAIGDNLSNGLGGIKAHPTRGSATTDNENMKGVLLNVDNNPGTSYGMAWVPGAVAQKDGGEGVGIIAGKPGVVIPDGTTITITEGSVISAKAPTLGVADDNTGTGDSIKTGLGGIMANPTTLSPTTVNDNGSGVRLNVNNKKDSGDYGMAYVPQAAAHVQQTDGTWKGGKLGVVIPDGQTITIDTTGVISASVKAELGVADDNTGTGDSIKTGLGGIMANPTTLSPTTVNDNGSGVRLNVNNKKDSGDYGMAYVPQAAAHVQQADGTWKGGKLGVVIPDGQTITIDAAGVISAVGGGGSVSVATATTPGTMMPGSVSPTTPAASDGYTTLVGTSDGRMYYQRSVIATDSTMTSFVPMWIQ